MLRDGWGSPYVTPLAPAAEDAGASGYGRLRDASDAALSAAGQEIRVIRHLGANGVRDEADTGYDRDVALVFSNGTLQAGLRGHVEVLDGDAPAVADAGDAVTVRVFGPDPDDAGRIRVWSTSVAFGSNPVIWELPLASGITPGPRVVRAYFNDANGSGTTPYRKSAVKTAVVRSGMNLLDLQIDR